MNEARNLPHVFADLPPAVHQVILVDGRSSDETVSIARQLRREIEIVHQTRKGKGNALACGFAAATGDVIVMLDADGSADPTEIPRFVDALCQGADFAKGSRFMRGGGSADISRFRQFGNFWLNKIVNILYGTRYSDLCYGYNAFWRYCLDVLDLDSSELLESEAAAMPWGDGFEVETLINIRIAKAGLKVIEVPSFERTRLHGVSNLNAFSDGFRVLRIIQTEHRRRRSRSAAPSGSSWWKGGYVDGEVHPRGELIEGVHASPTNHAAKDKTDLDEACKGQRPSGALVDRTHHGHPVETRTRYHRTSSDNDGCG